MARVTRSSNQPTRYMSEITASQMGKIGGSKKSLKKTIAARMNAKKPRKKKSAKKTK